MIELVVFAVAVVFVAGLIGNARTRARRPDAAARTRALFDQTREFVRRLADAGELPSVQALNLHLQSGEFPVLRESGVMLCGFKVLQVAARATRGTAIESIRFLPNAWRSEYS